MGWHIVRAMKAIALIEENGNGVKGDKIKGGGDICHLVDLLWEINCS